MSRHAEFRVHHRKQMPSSAWQPAGSAGIRRGGFLHYQPLSTPPRRTSPYPIPASRKVAAVLSVITSASKPVSNGAFMSTIYFKWPSVLGTCTCTVTGCVRVRGCKTECRDTRVCMCVCARVSVIFIGCPCGAGNYWTMHYHFSLPLGAAS